MSARSSVGSGKRVCRFTAAVLQKEVEGFERKLRVLRERLEGVVRENGELQEMCFYLDKSRERRGVEGDDGRATETSGGRKLGGGRGAFTFRAPVHSMCAEEMNRDPGPPLQYAGLTSDNTLRDKKGKSLNLLGTKGIHIHSASYPRMDKISMALLISPDPQAAVEVLQKRLEKLESEKLELVKVNS